MTGPARETGPVNGADSVAPKSPVNGVSAAKALTLDTDLVTALGKTNASALDKQFGMATVRDLVYHFPRRYDERGEQADIGKLEIGEHVTVLGRVERVVDKTFPNKKNPRIKEKMRVVTISDGTRGGRLTLTFFGKLVYATQGMVEGRWGLFAGKVTDFRGNRQLGTPQFQMLSVSDKDEAEDAIEEFAGALIPIYPRDQGAEQLEHQQAGRPGAEEPRCRR